MIERVSRHRITLAVLGGIVTLAVVIVLMIPAEKTLGEGIRSVFIHGAMILTGMLGLYIAGLLGLGVAVTGSEGIWKLTRTVGWVGFGMYVAGIVMSFPAARVNWGGIFLDEPRMRAGLNNIALALIVLVAVGFVKQIRANGLLTAGLAIFLAWSTYTAPLVLHPSNPIGTSPSPAIKLTFGALLALCVAASAWIVWRGSRQVQAENRE